MVMNSSMCRTTLHSYVKMYLVLWRHALLHFRFHSCCVHLTLGPLDSACLELLNKILKKSVP